MLLDRRRVGRQEVQPAERSSVRVSPAPIARSIARNSCETSSVRSAAPTPPSPRAGRSLPLTQEERRVVAHLRGALRRRRRRRRRLAPPPPRRQRRRPASRRRRRRSTRGAFRRGSRSPPSRYHRGRRRPSRRRAAAARVPRRADGRPRGRGWLAEPLCEGDHPLALAGGARVERGVDALERVVELWVDEQRAGAAQHDFDGEGDADALVAAEEHHVLHGRGEGGGEVRWRRWRWWWRWRWWQWRPVTCTAVSAIPPPTRQVVAERRGGSVVRVEEQPVVRARLRVGGGGGEEPSWWRTRQSAALPRLRRPWRPRRGRAGPSRSNC